jgi:hypothetical protein
MGFKVGFDRWNFDHFKGALSRAGFSEATIRDRFTPVGQGLRPKARLFATSKA